MTDPDVLPEDDFDWPPYEWATASPPSDVDGAHGASTSSPAAADSQPSTPQARLPHARLPDACLPDPSSVDWQADLGGPSGASRKEDERAQAEPRPRAAQTHGRAWAGGSHPATLLPLSGEPDLFPAFISRSALFAAMRPNSGGHHAGDIPCAGNASIMFEGPRLSMLDKRVWEGLVRLAKANRLDVSGRFDVPLADIARGAGLKGSSARAAWLSMERLAKSDIDAMVNGKRLAGRLLRGASRAGNACSAEFDLALMLPVLSEVLQAAMPATEARSESSPLRQWLLDYLSTHEQAKAPFTLDYLRSLSGYGSQAKRFPGDLREALASLEKDHPEIVKGWAIEGPHRKSDRWRLTVARGTASPVVKHPPQSKPADERVVGAAGAAPARRSRASRRGPAL